MPPEFIDFQTNSTLSPSLPLIADLHCDLLCYLGKSPLRTPYDLAARCSIPQLRQGNVKIQIMPIFSETSHASCQEAEAQVEAYSKLTNAHRNVFHPIKHCPTIDELISSKKIEICPAIENASSFSLENEKLEIGLKRLERWQHKIGKFAYISLTWNTENRFGGGALTHVGLKECGKKLLPYLFKKQIALDLSHASDFLAFDLFNFLDKEGIRIPLIASHSNFRQVVSVQRNLSDEIAQEIFYRGGFIGLNFIRSFVGPSCHSNIINQLNHASQLNPKLDRISLGADFFYEEDVSLQHRKKAAELFFPEYSHAGTYPQVFEMWKKNLGLSQEIIEKISYKNCLDLLKKIY